MVRNQRFLNRSGFVDPGFRQFQESQSEPKKEKRGKNLAFEIAGGFFWSLKFFMEV
jgi:hypothetical protein